MKTHPYDAVARYVDQLHVASIGLDRRANQAQDVLHVIAEGRVLPTVGAGRRLGHSF